MNCSNCKKPLILSAGKCIYCGEKPDQKQNNPQENGPSLEETLNWLKGKIESIYYYHKYTEDSIHGYSIHKYSFFNWEHFKIEYEYNVQHHHDSSKWSSTRKCSFELHKISNVFFNESHHSYSNIPNPLSNIVLETYNSEKLVKRMEGLMYHNCKELDSTNNYLDPSCSFQVFDKELGERICKAFQHAVRLCGGGKKEPF